MVDINGPTKPVAGKSSDGRKGSAITLVATASNHSLNRLWHIAFHLASIPFPRLGAARLLPSLVGRCPLGSFGLSCNLIPGPSVVCRGQTQAWQAACHDVSRNYKGSRHMGLMIFRRLPSAIASDCPWFVMRWPLLTSAGRKALFSARNVESAKQSRWYVLDPKTHQWQNRLCWGLG